MAHCVTQPTAPFTGSSGIEVHQIPVWQDNLVWLVVCRKTKEAAVVDGPEAGPVLDYAKAKGIEITTVLNTHTHFDHIGINNDLKDRGLLDAMRVVGPKRAASAVPGITEKVDDGDTVKLGEAEAKLLLTEGHIDGHISYVFEDVLFCGDTLFAGGCGYLFDGPPKKMFDSLSRLASLPEETRVCCAHEYTQDNLRFAWSVEPENEALAARIRQVWAIRSEGGCAVPSTIGEERRTNPFMRTDSADLVSHVKAAMPEAKLDTPVEIFTATRALKDRKDHRSIPDSALPL